MISRIISNRFPSPQHNEILIYSSYRNPLRSIVDQNRGRTFKFHWENEGKEGFRGDLPITKKISMIYHHLFDIPVEDISHYNVPLVWTTRYLVDHAPSCIISAGHQRGFFLIWIFGKKGRRTKNLPFYLGRERLSVGNKEENKEREGGRNFGSGITVEKLW